MTKVFRISMNPLSRSLWPWNKIATFSCEKPSNYLMMIYKTWVVTLLWRCLNYVTASSCSNNVVKLISIVFFLKKLLTRFNLTSTFIVSYHPEFTSTDLSIWNNEENFKNCSAFSRNKQFFFVLINKILMTINLLCKVDFPLWH